MFAHNCVCVHLYMCAWACRLAHLLFVLDYALCTCVSTCGQESSWYDCKTNEKLRSGTAGSHGIHFNAHFSTYFRVHKCNWNAQEHWVSPTLRKFTNITHRNAIFFLPRETHMPTLTYRRRSPHERRSRSSETTFRKTSSGLFCHCYYHYHHIYLWISIYFLMSFRSFPFGSSSCIFVLFHSTNITATIQYFLHSPSIWNVYSSITT